MQRFKVKSLQKLLIHINILLAFSVLFCSHSAFGEQSASGAYIDESSSSYYGADPKAVDFGTGFTVYWAKYNVGAINNNPNDHGTYFTWYEASTWNSSHNYQGWVGYWRTPTQSELEELKTLQHDHSAVSPGIRLTSSNTSSNNNSIDIPTSGCKNTLGTSISTGMAYLWSSTFIPPDHWYDPPRAYYLIYSSPTKVNVIDGNPDYKCPIRPVIDKVKLTVTAGVHSITKYYPRGTKVKIGAFLDECHKVASWTKTSNGETTLRPLDNTSGDNGDIEITITEDDVTYTANFSIKTTNVKATTNDNQKGTVELSIGTDNN